MHPVKTVVFQSITCILSAAASEPIYMLYRITDGIKVKKVEQSVRIHSERMT